MFEKSPLLVNEKIREEIRKHKWLESEKVGRDIGFATAAIDWIKKHSEEWLKHHSDEASRL